MKKKFNIFLVSVMALGASLSSCSDSYMEDLNTDESKANVIDPNAQLTTALLQSYGDFSQMEVYRSYVYAFTQQFMGTWNAAFYGGALNPDNDQMRRMWDSFYTMAVKNLVDGIHSTQSDDMLCVNAALRIQRVYIMSLLTDTYGDIPCTEAGLGFIDGIATPRYDKQEDIYNFFFTELAACVEQLKKGTDRLTGDVTGYAGDTSKWIKLANSLRMRFAMRISGVAPEKAKQEFEAAVNAEGGYISSSADDAYVNYMDVTFNFGQDGSNDYRGNALSKICFGQDPTGPTFICTTFYNTLRDTADPRLHRLCRFYYDVLRSQTSLEGRVDLTDEILAKAAAGEVTIAPCEPGAAWWNAWPAGFYSETVAALKEQYPGNGDINPTLDKESRPKLANNFLHSNNPGIIMTYAEVELLLAEAAVNGWNVNGDADEHYEKGVYAAMQLLVERYGCEPFAAGEIDEYIYNNGLGATEASAKNAINTQAWILHLTNPSECWANLRRSGYPRLLNRDNYTVYEYTIIDGPETPVRLKYPQLESKYNSVNYEEAIGRMGGTDNWHSHVWWDKE